MSTLTYIQAREQTERRIVRSLCTELMAQGCTVSLYYGEGDYGVERATKPEHVVKQMHACDMEWLHIYTPDSKRLGSVALVYGNDGYDVIADHSVSLYPFMPVTQALINELAGG